MGKIRDRLQILVAGNAGEPAMHRGIKIRLCHRQRNRIAVFRNPGQRRIGVAGQTCFIGVLRRHCGATAQEHRSEYQQDALHEFCLTSLFVPRPKFLRYKSVQTTVSPFMPITFLIDNLCRRLRLQSPCKNRYVVAHDIIRTVALAEESLP